MPAETGALRGSMRSVAMAAAVSITLVSAAFGASSSAPAYADDNTSTTCTPAVTGTWRVPVQQRYVITSTFGNRVDPITGKRRMHAGVDLAMQPGPGPVVAASAGTVVRAGPYGGLGNEVTIQHPGGVQTLYGHMARIDPAIRPGVKVREGQVLGTEGSTGHSTGPHLHFEVHVNGKAVDPVPFMTAHQAALDGSHPATASTGFALPAPKSPRRASQHQKPLPISSDLMALYVAAGQKYDVPWPLLAGVGMEETAHGRNNHKSSAGALGLMQFLPSTFAHYGVDGDGDGRTDIHDDADSVYSAAHALYEWGVKDGASGVRQAVFRYNHAKWYVNDVLYYAAAYAAASPGASCADVSDTAGQTSASAQAVAWAREQVGQGYKFGADGPDAWDSSSFVQAAYQHAGTTLPRTAQAQRNWLAAGHGTRVKPGDEQPGDLIFENSYLGPKQIGFVLIVTDPEADRGVAARNPSLGVADVDYSGATTEKSIFEIWRVK